jgi:hypothetical protein
MLVPGGHDGDIEILLDVAAAGSGVDTVRFIDGRGQVRGIVADQAGGLASPEADGSAGGSWRFWGAGV